MNPGNGFAIVTDMFRWLNNSKRITTLTFGLALGSGSVAAFQLVSVQDEIRIGQQAQQEIRQQTPQVRDAEIRQYVSRLGQQLARHASGENYPYTFSTADYRELNAFALPGGPVWVYRGVLAAAGNESQIAGVLAHEIAHIAQRHSARQLTKGAVANGLVGLLGALIGNDGAGAAAAQMAANMTASGVMLKFSRDDERQADREGLAILKRAGYDGRGMVEFMRMLAAQQGRSPGSVAGFLSTHPDPASRVRELEPLVSQSPRGRRDSAQFGDMRRRLAQLPPAPSTPRR